jgi:ABC-type nickel/cobalt efflux system permease component RcnA
MSRALRGLAAVSLALLAGIGWAGAVSAHPLGNYTVNRAVIVRLGPTAVKLRYVVDMAEIPAFGEIQAMDTNADGRTDAAELSAYAATACEADRRALSVQLDRTRAAVAQRAAPQLSFPAGAGGLSTLRLVCSFTVQLPAGGNSRTIQVADTTNDGHVGWHEVIIAADSGVSIATSDVPAMSRSAELTAYPLDSLQSPPDVRTGSATFRVVAGAAGSGSALDPAAPLVRSSANDPLAALVGGPLTPLPVVLGILLAAGLGAAHAVSPGHGKTLVAAYLIGSQGSRRHAATLGLTVAVTHTAGVFLLGAVTLLAGQFLVPERVIGWLTIGSGFLVVLLGAGLVLRAARGSHASHDHGHEHDHPHEHPHPHPDLRARNVVALGLAGGMVPSASALIVLLVAITTGRLLFGLVLIMAFGVGMSLILGGLAVATTMVRGAVTASGGIASHPLVRRAASAVPLVAGAAVLAAGLAVTLGALAHFA